MNKNKIPFVIPLQPDNFTHNVWGGQWIPRLKGISKSSRPVGESWEFSGHADHPSGVMLLDGTKTNLRNLIRTNGRFILGSSAKTAPFLVKLIDARENLSLQVHPADPYARRIEGETGKAESWVILQAGSNRGEGHIYLGFNKNLARAYKSPLRLQSAFQKALQKKSVPAILPFLNKISVKPGQIYNLPPGTIHAVGKGVRLFEIQQTSDLTYRIWDWNRQPARTFHLAKAFDVLDFKPINPSRFQPKVLRIKSKGKGIFREEQLLTNKRAGFALHKITLGRKDSSILQQNKKKFSVLTVIEGEAVVMSQRIRAGHSVLIPAFVKTFEVKSLRHQTIVFKSLVPS